MSDGVVSLSDAALRLGLSWHQAWRLVLIGSLKGNKRGGRWFVESRDLTQLLADRAGPPQKGTMAATESLASGCANRGTITGASSRVAS